MICTQLTPACSQVCVPLNVQVKATALTDPPVVDPPVVPEVDPLVEVLPALVPPVVPVPLVVPVVELLVAKGLSQLPETASQAPLQQL
jgi:hypothetical protein